MSLFVGVDVGGTTTTIAIGDHDANVLHVSEQFPTRSAEGPDTTIGEIVHQIVAALESLGHTPSSVTKISLATPGPATAEGVLLKTPNLDPKLWDRCPVKQKLQDEFGKIASGVPVAYIGDGQAAAYGEFSVRTGQLRWPSGPGPARHAIENANPHIRSLFMVAVGTGLGGGEVREGMTVCGSRGRAGHAGHLMLPATAFRYEHDRGLKVGNAFSTAESAISLTALTHQLGYRLQLDQWADHPLNQQEESDRSKAKQLRKLAASGDPLALELFDDQARAIGITLLMINYIGDYDRLVIGGGVCDITPELRERYLKTAERAYHQHALEGFRDHAGFSFSVCGDQSSVIGSLADAIRARPV